MAGGRVQGKGGSVEFGRRKKTDALQLGGCGGIVTLHVARYLLRDAFKNGHVVEPNEKRMVGLAVVWSGTKQHKRGNCLPCREC